MNKKLYKNKIDGIADLTSEEINLMTKSMLISTTQLNRGSQLNLSKILFKKYMVSFFRYYLNACIISAFVY